MKPQRWLLLAMSLPGLAAFEAAGQEAPRRPALPSAPGFAPAKAARRVEHGAYLGVASVRVTEQVAAQLGLAPGFGLLIEEVMPESPAARSGLRRHDVLVAYGDQELVNPEQLQALVRRGKKGDKVPLTVLSQAARKVVEVELDEGLVELAAEAGEERPASVASASASVSSGGKSQTRSQGRAVRRDDDGEYALSMDGETLVFTARPNEGQGGEWTVTGEEARRLVPEAHQPKLRALLEVLERSVHTSLRE